MWNIRANYQTMTMSWKENGIRRELKGDPSLCRSKSSLKTAPKALRDDGEGFLVVPMLLDSANSVIQHSTAAIEQLLGEFGEIFQIPSRLPVRTGIG